LLSRCAGRQYEEYLQSACIENLFIWLLKCDNTAAKLISKGIEQIKKNEKDTLKKQLDSANIGIPVHRHTQ
jgi:hypothetical protein